jgi:phospholipid/cholesterol/gamma-HCH transport system substrate-binding protein
MAPILKNRQYNFAAPIGLNGSPLLPFLPVNAQARPNEVTFSEDWMRPDFVPPIAPETNASGPIADRTASSDPGAVPPVALPAEAPLPSDAAAPVATDPSTGLPGLMVPQAAP